jgi:hypothetical protein
MEEPRRQYLWEGPKTARVEIRLTEAEKQDIEDACRERGGISIARHLLGLHHRDRGRLTEAR